MQRDNSSPGGWIVLNIQKHFARWKSPRRTNNVRGGTTAGKLRLSFLTAVVGLASGLTGCAYINPYAAWDRAGGNLDARGRTLDAAVKRARSVQQVFKSTYTEEAVTGNLLGAGIIGVGASMIGLGLYEPGTSAIKGLAVGGSTAYVAGQWLSAPSRSEAYLAGMTAIDCAVDAVEPLNFSEDRRSSLQQSIQALGNARTDTASNLGRVKGYTAALDTAGGHDDVVAKLRVITGPIEDQIKAADNVQSQSFSLLTEADLAAGNLDVVVAEIGTAVDKAVHKGLPTLESAKTAIAGIIPTATSLVPGLDQTASFAAINPQSQGLMRTKCSDKCDSKVITIIPPEYSALIEKLLESVARMESQRRYLESVLVDVASRIPKQKLKETCQIDLDKLSFRLGVRPESLNFTAGDAASTRVRIYGGKKPYGAAFTSSTPAAISLQLLPGDSSMGIQVTDAAVPGDYTILVYDATEEQNSATVSIHIVPKSAIDDTSPSISTNSPTKAVAGEINKKFQSSFLKVANAHNVETKYKVNAHDENNKLLIQLTPTDTDPNPLPTKSAVIGALKQVGENKISPGDVIIRIKETEITG